MSRLAAVGRWMTLFGGEIADRLWTRKTVREIVLAVYLAMKEPGIGWKCRCSILGDPTLARHRFAYAGIAGVRCRPTSRVMEG